MRWHAEYLSGGGKGVMDVGVVVGLMACCFELCRRPARREMGMVDFTLREFPNVVYALFLEKGSPDVIVYRCIDRYPWKYSHFGG